LAVTRFNVASMSGTLKEPLNKSMIGIQLPVTANSAYVPDFTYLCLLLVL
jgi:hypothetical protein